jgi:hypothetical protein
MRHSLGEFALGAVRLAAELFGQRQRSNAVGFLVAGGGPTRCSGTHSARPGGVVRLARRAARMARWSAAHWRSSRGGIGSRSKRTVHVGAAWRLSPQLTLTIVDIPERHHGGRCRAFKQITEQASSARA